MNKNAKRKRKNKENPRFFKLLLFIGIISFLIPLPTLFVFNYFFNAPNSAWFFLALIGALILGVGLFNAVMSFCEMSFGKKFTVLILCIGLALIVIGEILIFNSHRFNEELVSFYFITLLFLTVDLLFYFLFRGGVNSYLHNKHGLSKTNVRKHKKGFCNYWWYEAIHKDFKITYVYFLNKIYTLLFLLTFSLSLLFGFFKITSLAVCPLMLFLCALSVIMNIFSWTQHNIEEHGSKFVLFAKSPNDGIDSSFAQMLISVIFIGMAYAHVTLTLTLWQ